MGEKIEITAVECTHEMIRSGRFPFFSNCSFRATDLQHEKTYYLVDDQAEHFRKSLISVGVPSVHTPGIDQLTVARVQCAKITITRVEQYHCKLNIL